MLFTLPKVAFSSATGTILVPSASLVFWMLMISCWTSVLMLSWRRTILSIVRSQREMNASGSNFWISSAILYKVFLIWTSKKREKCTLTISTFHTVHLLESSFKRGIVMQAIQNVLEKYGFQKYFWILVNNPSILFCIYIDIYKTYCFFVQNNANFTCSG